MDSMEVGAAFVLQNPGDGRSDADVYRAELALAQLAEPLGFDAIWTTEHHFTDYMLVPDPLQFLTFMAGCTERVRLGSMVVVLPWHDPVRVAEQVSMLDHLSGGRQVLGLGRGAARVEFEGFRTAMEESRARFVESTECLLGALETGVLEYEGEFVKQPRRDLRPAPLSSFRGRAYAGTLSPEAAPIMARLGLGILIIPQKPWKEVARELDHYRRLFLELHDRPAPPPLASAWVYCHEDESHARQVASRYIGDYYRSTLDHYRFATAEFQQVEGYDYYRRIRTHVEKVGPDAAAQGFVDAQVWGTPQQCIDKARAIQAQVGCGALNAVFSYAGLPYEQAEASMRLFAQQVAPALR